MANDKFWEVVKNFNFLMRAAIQGPNCLIICNGDCCSIKINVPKILAEEFIRQGYAEKSDFVRGDVFSFKLGFNEKNGKCFLYDEEVNGCKVHDSGIKPPQCWIYPTNFTNPENKELSCKRAKGWRIIDTNKAIEAEKLLKYYIFLCQLEAKKEVKLLQNRLANISAEYDLKSMLRNTPPSQLAGFKYTWDNLKTLSAQGISLKMKQFCLKLNKNCDIEYLECKAICDKVIIRLLNFLQQNMIYYVQKNGPDCEGEYPFIKLFEYSKNNF
ncbi:MAG: YkgJ family cysteine cluster protein [Promethearchaeota archaeon]|nr:MAG: YkgJ family cysteine cluster protein [Candidatus Lokiarchaeota archaeon]